MYLPTPFTETRPEILMAVMRENSLAAIVTAAGGVPYASHVPVLVDGPAIAGALKIRGHFARANPHSKALRDGEQMLAIFHGPHCYVSPSWYEGSENVPTWNYVVVHAYGRVRPLDHSDSRGHLKELVDLNERSAAEPWRMESLPADLVDNLLTGIVGFEIAVDRLEGKLKLSQNRPPGDQRRVRDRLQASSDPTARDVARWMALAETSRKD
ncbi:MAG TPA: FMN-binding negative transcriptional regulator [Polyangia bacterium]|nr:FMN-binding negative transcriptional regulator [Polyangia bacterium]